MPRSFDPETRSLQRSKRTGKNQLPGTLQESRLKKKRQESNVTGSGFCAWGKDRSIVVRQSKEARNLSLGVCGVQNGDQQVEEAGCEKRKTYNCKRL